MRRYREFYQNGAVFLEIYLNGQIQKILQEWAFFGQSCQWYRQHKLNSLTLLLLIKISNPIGNFSLNKIEYGIDNFNVFKIEYWIDNFNVFYFN